MPDKTGTCREGAVHFKFAISDSKKENQWNVLFSPQFPLLIKPDLPLFSCMPTPGTSGTNIPIQMKERHVTTIYTDLQDIEQGNARTSRTKHRNLP